MHTVECKVILLHGTVIILRAVTEVQGPGISPATMSMTPSYFRRKQKKTRPQELTGC